MGRLKCQRSALGLLYERERAFECNRMDSLSSALLRTAILEVILNRCASSPNLWRRKGDERERRDCETK